MRIGLIVMIPIAEMDLVILLYKNGYPPEWNQEVFEKVLEQAENFKRMQL